MTACVGNSVTSDAIRYSKLRIRMVRVVVQVLVGHQVQMVQMVLTEHRGLAVLQEAQELMEHRVQVGHQELMVQAVHLKHQVLQVLQEQ